MFGSTTRYYVWDLLSDESRKALLTLKMMRRRSEIARKAALARWAKWREERAKLAAQAVETA